MRSPLHRSLAVGLALCAMFLRALLPDGWMPNAGASPFVICSIDGHHSSGDSKDHGRTHGPCAFAATAHLSPPTFFATAIGVSGEAVRLAAAFADESVFAASQFRPNTARAPPVSV